jgi:hypothetical protein
MRKRILSILILVILFVSLPGPALAQTYYFQVPKLDINIYWNDDGTATIYYELVFINDSSDPIEYVDLGLPNSSIDVSQISAEVDGNQIYYISEGEFQGEGSDGVAIGLSSNSIPSGQTGTVNIYVANIEDVLYPDSEDSDYVSAVFKNPYFISGVIHNTTDMRVTYHFPPAVQPDEPRWHESPPGFPPKPGVGFDEEGRIVYIWRNVQADLSTQYEFGASFPKEYVPASSIVRFNPFAWVSNISVESLFPFCCIGAIVLMIVSGSVSERRRKMQYLPPKISIEGHGIKRGLTAVEAAILLEQPLDKVLTMILFSVIKKGAAEVVRRDPLEVKALSPQPEDLYDYEKDFLGAVQEKSISVRQKRMETTVIALVKSIAEKMKGFSRAETAEYYKSITRQAWEQVEAANTPEIKSQKFDEVMEWTMLDRNYDDRTRDVFRDQTVFVPMWWGRFDPVYSSRPSGGSISTSKPSASGTSLPHLPGSDFAASMVNGVQGFSAGVVGNVTNFTSRITGVTNPLPKSTSSGSYKSGGSSGGRSCACACACACAGCACACAGGGR